MEYIFISKKNPMYKQAAAIRYHIFFKPYGLGWDMVYDNLEEKAVHLICIQGEEVLGYGRLTYETEETVAVSQLVVKESYQNQGIGKGLMKHFIHFSRKEGYREIILNAKVEVMGFYEKLGFLLEGDTFPSKKTGIPHIKMIKEL